MFAEPISSGFHPGEDGARGGGGEGAGPLCGACWPARLENSIISEVRAGREVRASCPRFLWALSELPSALRLWEEEALIRVKGHVSSKAVREEREPFPGILEGLPQTPGAALPR